MRLPLSCAGLRMGPFLATTSAEHLLPRAATRRTGSPRDAAWIARARVVPVMSRLPESSAAFWSAGLVKGRTSTRGTGAGAYRS